MKGAHAKIEQWRANKAAAAPYVVKQPTAAALRRTAMPRRPIAFALDPKEMELERLSRILQEALAKREVSLQQALRSLPKVRKQLYRELYGRR
jgi:hypothetical protein